jgi:hypothetical protein
MFAPDSIVSKCVDDYKPNVVIQVKKMQRTSVMPLRV